MRQYKLLGLTISLTGVMGLAHSIGLTEKQTATFHQAVQAFEDHDQKTYQDLQSQLDDTPISNYLRIKIATEHPDALSKRQLDALIDQQDLDYWKNFIQKQLVLYYGDHQQWDPLLHYYQPGLFDQKGACWQAEALYQTGQQQQALNQFTSLWTSNAHLPEACDGAVKQAWLSSPLNNAKHQIQRALVLAKAGQFDAAATMAKGTDMQAFYEHLANALHQPDQYLIPWIKQYQSSQHFDTLLIALTGYLMGHDIDVFAPFWKTILVDHTDLVSTSLKQRINRAIAITYARKLDLQAIEWFKKVQPRYQNSLSWAWQLRLAIYYAHYQTYLDLYAKAPDAMKAQPMWQYWEARSFQQLGRYDQGINIYQKLADQASFFGFLAADQLHWPYALMSQQSTAIKGQQRLIALKQRVNEAAALYQVGNYAGAYHVWLNWLNQSSRIEQLAAANLAGQQSFYQLSVVAYANAQFNNDYQGLYPQAYAETVKKAAKQYDLQPSLIWSLMRQESAYRPAVRSGVQAGGLMQLMPATAAFIAKRYKIDYDDTSLTDPTTNIMIGAANLHFLNQLFDDHIVLGLAAYNAGQGNVKKWLPPYAMSAPRWMMGIPYQETRQYIQKVLFNNVIYQQVILHHSKHRLDDDLSVVPSS